MANSLIEDILNEQPENNAKGPEKQPKSGKKKSRKMLIIVIILIILIVCALFAINYLKNSKEVISNRAKFFEVLANNNMEEVTDVDLYEELTEKIVSEDSNINTEITLDLSDFDPDFENMNLAIETQNDIDNKISISDITWNYENTELLNLQVMATSQAIGFTSDQIITQYVGFSYDYIWELLDSNNGVLNSYDETYEYNAEIKDSTSEGIDDTDEITEETEEDDDYVVLSSSSSEEYFTDDTDSSEFLDINELIEYLNNMEMPLLSDSSKAIYQSIIDENLDESLFTSQEVTLQMDSGNVDATEYALTISEAKFADLLKQILVSFETDTETLDSISGLLDIFGIDSSYINMIVEEMITEIDESEFSDSEELTIKVYDNNGQTVKVSIEYSEVTMEIEYGYGDSENYVKVTAIEGEDSGVTYKVTNIKTDLKNEFDVELSSIEESVVTETIKFSSSIVKSGSTYNLVLGLYVQDEEDEISIEIFSDVTFETVELDEPVYGVGEEFVILDELDEETMEYWLSAITGQIGSVEEDITDTISGEDTGNNSTTVIEELEATPVEVDEEEEAALTALQEKIDELKNENSELTLSDLENLSIEGYTVVVEVGEDLAIITIDDEYIFNVNSDFEISD